MPSIEPILQQQALIADAHFWPQAARALLQFGAAHRCTAPWLSGLTVLVPAWEHAQPLRTALRGEIGAAFVPPRIGVLRDWTRRDWMTFGQQRDLQRRTELFEALRGNAWVRELFGAQPAALWALAQQVASLCDELTFAGAHDLAAFEGRLQAALAKHFKRRAAQALEPQAQLVLQLWRAGHADLNSGAAATLHALRERAAQLTQPLVLIAAEAPAPWLRAWLQQCAQRVPVCLITPDVASTVQARPLLAAAWPELLGQDDALRVVLAQRAAALTLEDARTAPAIIGTASLEEEAHAIAQYVLQCLRVGVAQRGPIALVAIDRVTARRVRALLERAQVLVRDETGWKLATTSAAGVVMRWFDLVANNFYYRDVLDWLKSPFTLQGLVAPEQKPALIEAVEKSIREQGVVQGLNALRKELPGLSAEQSKVFDALETHARATRRAQTLSQHVAALDAALQALGVREGLTADAMGRAVLHELEGLRGALSETGRDVRAVLPEFRALLAGRLEEVSVTAEAIDSPVLLVSLAGTRLRDFAAAVLIGVDAQQLPSLPPELLFFSQAVRAELGVPTAADAAREQQRDLALLLARVPQVIATWRQRDGDEPRPLASWFVRLHRVALVAGVDPLQSAQLPLRAVEGSATPRPQPRLSQQSPQRWPQQLSASGYQSLINCAYQFYARYLLRLQALDDVIETPEKRHFGDAVHAVLARFHRDCGDMAFDKQDRAQLIERLREQARAVFDPWVARAPRFLAFQQQFDDTVASYIDWLRERSAEGWRWSQAEVKLVRTFDIDAQRQIELVGRIDRIDQRGDELAVLDYKTKAALALRSGLNPPGEDVQLPFYGLLLAQRPSAAAYVALEPERDAKSKGGVASIPLQPVAEIVQQVEQRLRSDLQRIADGAALPAIGEDSVCEFCEMRGLCRRDYWLNETQPDDAGAQP